LVCVPYNTDMVIAINSVFSMYLTSNTRLVHDQFPLMTVCIS